MGHAGVSHVCHPRRETRRPAKFLKGEKHRDRHPLSKPNHLQPAVIGLFPYIPKLPKTEKAVKEILSLPIHGEMGLDAADKVCDAIAEFYGKK
jgi:dTDP-4-amino-4,6-dideoxygalactose transaminase